MLKLLEIWQNLPGELVNLANSERVDPEDIIIELKKIIEYCRIKRKEIEIHEKDISATPAN